MTRKFGMFLLFVGTLALLNACAGTPTIAPRAQFQANLPVDPGPALTFIDQDEDGNLTDEDCIDFGQDGVCDTNVGSQCRDLTGDGIIDSCGDGVIPCDQNNDGFTESACTSGDGDTQPTDDGDTQPADDGDTQPTDDGDDEQSNACKVLNEDDGKESLWFCHINPGEFKDGNQKCLPAPAAKNRDGLNGYVGLCNVVTTQDFKDGKYVPIYSGGGYGRH